MLGRYNKNEPRQSRKCRTQTCTPSTKAWLGKRRERFGGSGGRNGWDKNEQKRSGVAVVYVPERMLSGSVATSHQANNDKSTRPKDPNSTTTTARKGSKGNTATAKLLL